MPTRLMRSRVPSRITNALRAAVAMAWCRVGGERGEYLNGLVDVAEDGGRAYAEPDGQVGVGLALAQVCDHEQGLLADGQSSPARAEQSSVVAQGV